MKGKVDRNKEVSLEKNGYCILFCQMTTEADLGLDSLSNARW